MKEVEQDNFEFDPNEVVRVRTELKFEGDIRKLKGFLLKNKEYFPPAPPAETAKRDIPVQLRKEVFERDKGLCVLCGEKGEQIDHIILFTIIGKHEIKNLRLLCLKCHHKTFKTGKIDIKISNNEEPEIIMSNIKKVTYGAEE